MTGAEQRNKLNIRVFSDPAADVFRTVHKPQHDDAPAHNCCRRQVKFHQNELSNNETYPHVSFNRPLANRQSTARANTVTHPRH